MFVIDLTRLNPAYRQAGAKTQGREVTRGSLCEPWRLSDLAVKLSTLYYERL
jgi:hypothetical protein